MIVEVNERLIHGETLDVAAFGAKLQLNEPIEEGTLVTLHIEPPAQDALEVDAIVWRTDADGSVFFFMKKPSARVQATKGSSASR